LGAIFNDGIDGDSYHVHDLASARDRDQPATKETMLVNEQLA
jgi:hypothetical protein